MWPTSTNTPMFLQFYSILSAITNMVSLQWSRFRQIHDFQIFLFTNLFGNSLLYALSLLSPASHPTSSSLTPVPPSSSSTSHFAMTCRTLPTAKLVAFSHNTSYKTSLIEKSSLEKSFLVKSCPKQDLNLFGSIKILEGMYIKAIFLNNVQTHMRTRSAFFPQIRKKIYASLY